MRSDSILSPASSAVGLQQRVRAVEALARSGDVKNAIRLAGKAVRDGAEHATLLALAAYEQIDGAAYERALDYANRARELSPRNADALNAVGLALTRLNRPSEALAVFDAALRQAPGAAHIQFNKACAFELLHDTKRARMGFERVIALQPAHAEALSRLAGLASMRGDVAATRDYADRSLRANPHSVSAKLALAAADIEEKRFAEALQRLAPVMPSSAATTLQRLTAESMLGDALDGLGRCAEAFAAYARANAATRKLYRSVYEAPGIETALARVLRLIEYFTDPPTDVWQCSDGAAAEPSRAHVFLVGFPRSGTTLLERVLDTHPDIEAMSELECLTEAANAFMGSNADLDRLSTLNADALDQFRDLYWRRVSEHGIAPSKKVFVDKMPLNAVQLCLIRKLFPQARIIFAIRDPRDMILSCFRRRFGMTPQMYQLLTLNGCATYYDAVMRLLEIYKQKLGLHIQYWRYESMLADFEGETRRLCGFLGVEWDSAMIDFADRARATHITTPSAPQVVRGLYRESEGQWRRYRAELEPVLPVLAAWVNRFGYSEN
jgi:tetratricopeptide (TPR) repeat protein